jgi:hypothetical protein
MSNKEDSELQLETGLNEEHAADHHRSPSTSPSGQQLSTPLAQSNAAYLLDLPELLQHHLDEWVAYADGKQLRFGKTQTELYRYCLVELGLTHDHFVVRLVVPESDPTIEYNLR